jgi:sulfhydrogenase subunit alpha
VLDISVSAFEDHFQEEQVHYSNALHCSLVQRGSYLVGPLARYNLNSVRLNAVAREAASQAGLGERCTNPFQSIIVRAVETVHACDEALRIIGNYEMPDQPAIDFQPRTGTGYGCTEAPRGILYHRYRINDEGIIEDARIVPPTSQNQRTIEADLMQLVPELSSLSQERLTWQCEQAIRNYDPCISCATHFLKTRLDRE